ncbi:hypothetical protein EV138_4653 [Kribbella voronezhensis]|uniref:Uncharacterized protein n=1 Tax=Kribbella voronezhensis TaxID=2512212 RepID=A0A4R7TFL3_9ACTN|nr:hypothetical protein [Kribbella voronezhensis]TDU91052.1 hypothetical protein EV138_4653 [Kribbella voronezhensis]
MKSLVVLRVVAVTHAIALCLQPVLAGSYLNGAGAAMRMHEPIGLAAVFLCLGQLLIATIWWRTGGRALAVGLTAAMLAGEVLQVTMGYTRNLLLHIPVGITLVGTGIAVAVWTCRPATRVRRTEKAAA